MRRMSRMRDRVDLTSLVAGAAIAVFGALILLQEEGTIISRPGGSWRSSPRRPASSCSRAGWAPGAADVAG